MHMWNVRVVGISLTKLLSILLLAVTSDGVNITIQCNAGQYLYTYSIYSLKLLVNDTGVAIAEDNKTTVIPNSTLSVVSVRAALANTQAFLTVVTDTDCRAIQAATRVCKVFGMQKERKENEQPYFLPTVHLPASIDVLPARTVYPSNALVVINSTMYLDSNTTSLVWQYKTRGDGEYKTVPPRNTFTHVPTYSGCFQQLLSTVIYTPQEEGQIEFRCLRDDLEVARLTLVTGNDEDVSDYLSLNLFLSSIFVVYLHFIILPWLWIFFPKPLRQYRTPGRRNMVIRSFVTLGVDVIFFAWWSLVYTWYGGQEESTSYMAFAAIEFMFIGLYFVFRLVTIILDGAAYIRGKTENSSSHTLNPAPSGAAATNGRRRSLRPAEKNGKTERPLLSGSASSQETLPSHSEEDNCKLDLAQVPETSETKPIFDNHRLYNCRVALSFGAVIAPPICWILIKCQNNLQLRSGFFASEMIFGILTLVSLVGFVFVSNDREGKTWEKSK